MGGIIVCPFLLIHHKSSQVKSSKSRPSAINRTGISIADYHGAKKVGLEGTQVYHVLHCRQSSNGAHSAALQAVCASVSIIRLGNRVGAGMKWRTKLAMRPLLQCHDVQPSMDTVVLTSAGPWTPI